MNYASSKLIRKNCSVRCFAKATLLSATTLISATSLAQSGTNYLPFEVQLNRLVERVYNQDMNGDGLVDILLTRFDSALGRELHIHHQLADGRFEADPQRVEIKTEIIGFGFADLRPDPGMELVLLANRGVFSLSTAQEGYAGNLRPLLQWDLSASTPPQRQLLYFAVEDVNGDGHADLLLPGQEKYGLFWGGENEQFQTGIEFATENQNLSPAQLPRDSSLSLSIQVNRRDGVVMDASDEMNSPFAELVEESSSNSSNENSADFLLDYENWLPTARVVDINGDGRNDIAYLNIGDDLLGQLNVHYQSSNRSFSKVPDQQWSLETDGELSLVDFNKDGYTDLIRQDDSSSSSTVFLYQNGPEGFSLEEPTQIMRFSGYDVELNFIDVTVDAAPALSVSYYTIPVVDAIRNASIERTQLLYRAEQQDSETPFPRRPNSSLQERFSADQIRALSEQMNLRHDIDGDGKADALFIEENGSIAAKKITNDLNISSDSFWQYVPPRTVTGYQVLPLNQDGIPDLILHHNTSATVLVSQP